MNRRRLGIGWLILGCGLAACISGGTATVGPAADLSVILGRPTDRAVTLSLLSAGQLEAAVEYGYEPAALTQRTAPRPCEAGAPVEFEISGLKPDAACAYRVLTRAPATPEFTVAAEGRFHTQRATGATFAFAVQGDSHPEREGNMYSPALYAQTLRRVAADPPDFYLTLGDDFSIERLIGAPALSQGAVDSVYAHQRTFLGLVGCQSPLFLVNGNHEQAAFCNLDDTENSAAVLAGLARKRFFPLPAPDAFYGGNTNAVKGVGLPRDYYAWTWGDALFVVIDFYWHSPAPVDNGPGDKRPAGAGRGEGGRKRDIWNVTLGDAQYQWLARTLGESRSRWKFVFCHHVLGTGRGGIEMAGLGEWGGRDRRNVDAFTRNRPGWAMPIHQLLATNGVTIFFQGHDHLFARQVLDGVVYQSCPNPADPTYRAFNRESYRSGDALPNSGVVRVTVSPMQVDVDYIRSWLLPQDESDGHRDGETAFHYTVSTSGRSP